jgi:hypothetical protein
VVKKDRLKKLFALEERMMIFVGTSLYNLVKAVEICLV